MSPDDCRRPHWAWMPALAGFFAALLVVTWGRWADVFLDFGRDAYLAWRVSEGDVLYRDVFEYNGPLSIHVNAVLFRVFGVGYHTLFIANAIVLGAIVGCFVRIERRLLGASGVGAGAVFLGLCGIAQLTRIGSYSYLAPYSHELTHGLLLSLLCALSLARAAERGSRRWAVIAGAFLGLGALTKIEIAFALLPGALVALVVLIERRSRAAGLGAVLGFGLGAGGSMLAVLLAVAISTGSLEAAVSGVSVPIVSALTALDEGSPFFDAVRGTADPVASVVRMMRAAGIWLVVVAVAYGGSRLWTELEPRHRALRHATLGVLVAFAALGASASLHDFFRPLPIFLVIGGVALGRTFLIRREASDPRNREKRVLAAFLVVFAALLLAKMALFARVAHYGFVLAAPAVVLLFVASTGPLVSWMGSRGASPRSFAWVVRGIWAGLVATHVGVTALTVRQKQFELAEIPADGLVADGARGAAVAEAIRLARARLGPDQSLLVAPDGVSLNYLARRRAPVPFPVLLPVQVAVFGEDALLEALRMSPPDLVLWADVDLALYGVRDLADYAPRIDSLLRTDYRLDRRIEPPGSALTFGLWVPAESIRGTAAPPGEGP